MASNVVKFVGSVFSVGYSAYEYFNSNNPAKQTTDKPASIQPGEVIAHTVKIGFAELSDQVRELRKAQVVLDQRVARQERCSRYLVVTVVAETVLLVTGCMAAASYYYRR